MLCKEKEKKSESILVENYNKLRQNAVDLIGGKNRLFKSDKTLIKIVPAKNNEITQTII